MFVSRLHFLVLVYEKKTCFTKRVFSQFVFCHLMLKNIFQLNFFFVSTHLNSFFFVNLLVLDLHLKLVLPNSLLNMAKKRGKQNQLFKVKSCNTYTCILYIDTFCITSNKKQKKLVATTFTTYTDCYIEKTSEIRISSLFRLIVQNTDQKHSSFVATMVYKE